MKLLDVGISWTLADCWIECNCFSVCRWMDGSRQCKSTQRSRLNPAKNRWQEPNGTANRPENRTSRQRRSWNVSSIRQTFTAYVYTDIPVEFSAIDPKGNPCNYEESHPSDTCRYDAKCYCIQQRCIQYCWSHFRGVECRGRALCFEMVVLLDFAKTLFDAMKSFVPLDPLFVIKNRFSLQLLRFGTFVYDQGSGFELRSRPVARSMRRVFANSL